MGLLFLTKVRWNDLWNALEEMKHLVAPTFHVQLHKISIVGVIYIILSTALILTFQVVGLTMNGKASPTETCLEIWTCFFLIFSQSTAVLFCISSLTASKQLVNIRQKFSQLIADKPDDMVHQIDKLWQYYFMNQEFIYQINHCFGAVLLWEILNDFVAITVAISWAVVNFSNATNLYISCTIAVYMLVKMINLSGIILVADNITQQTSLLVRELNRLAFLNPALKKEVNDFIAVIQTTTPGISATGYFNISKPLLATMVGGIVSFFFIFCQFYWSEKP